MGAGSVTRTANGYVLASPEQVKHLLETHLHIYIGQANKEVYITYSLACNDKKCPCPDKPVIFRSCPTAPCTP